MFRDESSKVIQKAHAQWGVPEPADGGGPSTFSPISPFSPVSSPISSTFRGDSPLPSPPASISSFDDFRVLRGVDNNIIDKGIQFYSALFLIGHPDEPQTQAELPVSGWISSAGVPDVMAAVGLAGLSNLTGDQEMDTAAKEKYGMALQRTAKSLKDIKGVDFHAVMRSVVSLAMFEIVRGTSESTDGARMHIVGAAALMSSYLPVPAGPVAGFRQLLQLCFSLFIPCYVIGMSLPSSFFDWIRLDENEVSPEDRPSVNLILTISRFVQFAASLNTTVFLDGRPNTVDVIQQALEFEGELEAWETMQGVSCAFTVEDGKLPPKAAYENQYHAYADMYTARVWNHYRWARIVSNQMILDFVDRFPLTSPPIILPEIQQRSINTIRRLAHDILVSTPTHWRDPRLSRAHREMIEGDLAAGAGVGAAGIPALMFQLKFAADAPGVPEAFRPWAIGVMETVWGETGMLLARSLADILRSRGSGARKDTFDGIFGRNDGEVTLSARRHST